MDWTEGLAHRGSVTAETFVVSRPALPFGSAETRQPLAQDRKTTDLPNSIGRRSKLDVQDCGQLRIVPTSKRPSPEGHLRLLGD